MLINEAIILAGGLGTRLRTALPELPKCMAPVNGKPFIFYVIDYLKQQGIQHFIFALGYKNEYFIDELSQLLPADSYSLSIEEEPLGTGGAVHLASTKCRTENVLLTNGDTLFKFNLTALSDLHNQKKSACTLSLKLMENFDRYGVVTMNDKNCISSFQEKKFYETGLINGGAYALNIPTFTAKVSELKFSFEKDYLEKYYTEQHFFGLQQDGYFIDIGIPADYLKAQKDFINEF